MKAVLLSLFLLIFATESHGDTLTIELTPDYLATCPLEFGVTSKRSGDLIRFKVSVQRKDGAEFEFDDRDIGGRVDLCSSGRALQGQGMPMKKLATSVLFSFSVARKDLSKRCFHFWIEGPLPGGELYWFNLASPPTRKANPK